MARKIAIKMDYWDWTEIAITLRYYGWDLEGTPRGEKLLELSQLISKESNA